MKEHSENPWAFRACPEGFRNAFNLREHRLLASAFAIKKWGAPILNGKKIRIDFEKYC